MALSPDGAFVAVACLDGKVRVLSSGERSHGCKVAKAAINGC
jgi:hypothetical protein